MSAKYSIQILVALLFTWNANVHASWFSDTDNADKQEISVVKHSQQQLPDFARLAQDYSPAVVNIEVINAQDVDQKMQYFNGQQVPDIFKHFFGEPSPRNKKKLPPKSFGSGFVIDKEGYIVTNYHVVAEAKSIIVRFQDRQELEATVVGNDQLSDISVLKVESKEDLPYLKFGNSEELQVGQWVAAIGAPFGFDYSIINSSCQKP